MQPDEKLRPHQRDCKRHLIDVLNVRGAALDGGDTGTGKTYTACAVAAEMDVPTLAVVPKISRRTWRDVASYLGTSISVEGWEKIRAGTSPYGQWQFPLVKRQEFFVCTKCFAKVEPESARCPNTFSGIHCVEVKKRKHHYGDFIWNPRIQLLILDEVHRANGIGSLTSRMLVGAKRQGIKTLGLSATPACTPLHFQALGYALGLHDLDGPNGFYRWARHHGCRPHPVFKGWAFLAGREKQVQIMDRIHQQLFPAAGVRTRTQDIPGFPKRLVEARLFDLEASGRIQALYAEMREALLELHRAKARDVAPDSPLTSLLRARQEVELLKVPVMMELAEDYLAQGNSVALFVNFSQTLEELSTRLKCRAIIDGERKDREEVIARFQRDEEHLVLVNSRAGGIAVSLHDVLGVRARVGLVMPDTWVVTMRQVFGRLHRDGGKSLAYYLVLLAAGTKEEQVYKKFQAKSNNLDTLLDSDLVPDDFVFDK